MCGEARGQREPLQYVLRYVRGNIPQKDVKFHPAQCPIDGFTHNEGYIIYSQHVWSAQIQTSATGQRLPHPPWLNSSLLMTRLVDRSATLLSWS